VTVAAVGTGVASSGLTDELRPTKSGFALSDSAARDISGAASLGGRELAVTRDFDRMAVAGASNVEKPKPVGVRWTTEELKLRQGPTEDAKVFTVLDSLTKVAVTGRNANGFAEILVDGKARWVTADYLVKEKPEPEPEPEAETAEESEGTPAVGGDCTNGTSVSGAPNVLKVHEAVCAAFPSITTYGTYRGDGEHSQGIAIDIMVSGDTGWQVAEFVRAHAGELGVNYVIYSQQIWSVDRSGEGWRGMEDRGSTTANHYDHVHVTTY
jgi:hypothetical protein